MTLCRKILTYRGIDTGLAVASLGMLPFEQMVKEVKASVPSIQSDFSRLRTVALVGEEVARMWDQETLLIVFQSLQMNARWWHILSSHGIKIDARAFQSADSNLREAYMKGVVPDLLLHTNLNLDLAYEYCQQFNLEPEVATLCYIESIMLLPPYVSSSWKTSLQLASVGISEKLLVSRLRKVLEKIHPLDYDKIQYSCTWLANAIGDDQDRESVSTNGKGKPSHTSISDTAAQVEFKNYLMYSETVTFLSAHHFPTDLLCSISHIKSYYSNVPESFKTRLPFWSLLEEPWAIIEPLMAADPDAATKLSPLCTILHIDKDEFYSRAIMSSYTHAYEASGSKSFVTENYNSSVTIGVDQKVVEASKLALNSVRDSIGLIAGCFRQIELWRWVFEKELHTNPSIAVVALNEAVALLEVRSQELKISTAEDKDDELLEVNCILSELQLERVKISCRLCLQYLETKFSTTDSHLFDAKKTLSLISHPTAMLQKIFEDAVECCWSLQLKSVRMYASVYTVRDLISQPLAPSVATLIDSVGDKVVEICDICKVLTDNTIRPYLISVDSENVFTAKKPSTLNTDTDTTSGKDMKKSKVNDQVNAATELDLECDIRSTIVTKLLADIDPLVESSSGPGSKSATASGMQHNASVMTSFETATSIKNKKVNGAFSASLWGRSDDSTLSLTESELRRRDDLYLAFSLAVVVGSCRNIDNK